MMQFWFITIIFLIYTSLLLLTPQYGVLFPILLNMREFLLNKKIWLIIVTISAYFLTFVNCFFPNIPGPFLLGDLFVTISLLISSIWYTMLLIDKDKNNILTQERKRLYVKFALLNLVIALLHFILPNWVLF